MKKKNISYLKMGIVTSLAVYAVLGLLLIGLGFTYLNQSSLTPENERLNFWNYLLPFLLTVGFILNFVVIQATTNHFKGGTQKLWINIILVSIGAVIAIKWQIEQILWLFEKSSVDILEWIPFLTGFTFTVGTVIQKLSGLRKSRL